jgi:hypothetical protein
VQTGAGLPVPASTVVGSRAPDESSRFATNVRQLDAIGEALAQATYQQHSLARYVPVPTTDPARLGRGRYVPRGVVNWTHPTRVEREHQQTVHKVNPKTGQPLTHPQTVTDQQDELRTTPLPFTGRLNVGVHSGRKKTHLPAFGESVGLRAAAKAPNLGNTGDPIPPPDLQARAAALVRHRNVRGATVILDVDPRGGFTPQTAFPNREVTDATIEAVHSGDVVTREHTALGPNLPTFTFQPVEQLRRLPRR